MDGVVIYADTVRSGEMRHELPLVVPDPFLYAEVASRRYVVIHALEGSRIAAVGGGVVVHTPEEFGFDELLAGGAERADAELEVAVRACQELGLARASVPGGFPLELADRLRAAGVVVEPDRRLFESRRRVKSDAEVAGVRRAQRAADAGMRAAAELLRRAAAASDGLEVSGEPLTCERLREVIRDAVARMGASAEELIVSHGAQTAIGHEQGSGRILPGEPVMIDLFPRDSESACFADMTRTFVVGEAPDELRRYHELTRASLERARLAVRAGAEGCAIYGDACEPYEQAGIPTQRTKNPGEALTDGFYHSLGHGVGLEVHEPPLLGRAPDVLVAGDVVTLEPGCYRRGFGGCRLEDLVLVTEHGGETLTDFPYQLEP
jgi:Xaa-Pro aminopeptidase